MHLLLFVVMCNREQLQCWACHWHTLRCCMTRIVACAMWSRDGLHLKVALLHHMYEHMSKKKKNNLNTHEGVGPPSF